MVNYQNGKIYKIESFEGKCQYIGSTCQQLSRRMSGHRRDNISRRDCSSKEVLKYKDAKIYLIENHPCNSKEELLRKEAEYIRQLDCVNNCIPGRTHQEYYIDNKDMILEKAKQYRGNNKEKINISKKIHYQINKEKILKKNKEYRDNNIEKVKQRKKRYQLKNKEIISEKHKQYHIDNKEKLNNKSKLYRLKNKEILKQKQKIKYTCECGSNVSKSNKSIHMKSKKHITYINNNGVQKLPQE